MIAWSLDSDASICILNWWLLFSALLNWTTIWLSLTRYHILVNLLSILFHNNPLLVCFVGFSFFWVWLALELILQKLFWLKEHAIFILLPFFSPIFPFYYIILCSLFFVEFKYLCFINVICIGIWDNKEWKINFSM